MITRSLALLLFCWQAQAASNLSPELEKFLGPPPPNFQKKFLKPAKVLRSALEKVAKGKIPAAISELTPLALNSGLWEHAGYELAILHSQQKHHKESIASIRKILTERPGSPYRDQLEDLLKDEECALSLADAEKAKTDDKKSAAIEGLFLCLQKTSWKEWGKREDQATKLFTLLRSTKNPLMGPFVAEVIQAMPANTKLRILLQKEIPDADLKQYADIAKFRSNNPSPSGVRAISPDGELFDKGIQQALGGDWKSAKESFLSLLTQFPQSEHLDRAQYWVARSEHELGNEEEAKKRFTAIADSGLLSYYGLQSALRLGRDLSQSVQQASELKVQPMKGSLLPQQALSIWRIRALLEVSLVDQAATEAKFLFQHRPGGFTFGQDSGQGALLVAMLYQAAGYPLASFSHAYAATSLDPSLFNNLTLEFIFPNRFRKEFDEASLATGINPLLLLSVAKQESGFFPKAISKANALGLLQLLLPTAVEVEKGLTVEQLFDPATNTKVGARYLQKLLDRFKNIPLALAAYNAGPTRAASWEKKFMENEFMRKNFDCDFFMDSIPFTETRKYVAAIMRNYAWYKLLQKDGKFMKIEELATQWQNPTPSPPNPEEKVPSPQAI